MADRFIERPLHGDSDPPEWLVVQFYASGERNFADVNTIEGPFESYAEAEARGITLLEIRNWKSFQVTKVFTRR